MAAGWLAGWLVGVCDIKANSVQLLLQLPTGTELGNIDYSYTQKTSLVLSVFDDKMG